MLQRVTFRFLWRLLMVGCLAVQTAHAAHAAAERFALVIGNADYTSHYFGQLRNPVNDAEAIAAALKKLGFKSENVFLYRNLDIMQFRQARDAVAEKLRENPDSTVLVYFSGHGVQGNDGKNYLIPIGDSIEYYEDVSEQGIGIDKILETLDASQPKMTLFIIDACRDGVTLKSRAKKASAIAGTMSVMSAATGSLIAFASQFGKSSWDFLSNSSEEKNSV